MSLPPRRRLVIPKEPPPAGSEVGAVPTRRPRAPRRPVGAWPKVGTGRAVIEGWFESRGWTPFSFQRDAWEASARGESGLIQVPTGAGKTYAAFMGALIDLIDNPPEPGTAGRVIYLTPLRSVARDIALALEAPIRDLGLPLLVETRTGDTSSSVRAKQRERLPDVLLTTPESLSLLIAREDAASLFAGLRTVICDEWHELVSTKRGTQAELALARLRAIAPRLRTWGMSATLPNLDEAASALVGTACPARIVRGSMEREVVIDSVLPRDPDRLPWAGHLGLVMLEDLARALDPAVPTLIFTNTRSQAERWYHALTLARPEWRGVMALHHGSIDRAEREAVEAGLKSGSLRLVVATSSLDLGVDFSPVERVVQVGSPKGIARLMQRAGRASHRPLVPCRISCVPTHTLELVEIAAARAALSRGEVEPRSPLPKPLDVLAQHMVTRALGGGFTPEGLFAEVRTAWSYRDLTRQEFDWALALVRDGGGTLRAYPQYHKVAPDPHGIYRVPSAMIARLHRLNVGTITSDTTLELRLVSGRPVGRVEENFVSNLRYGDRFVFAGKTLEFIDLRDCIARVRPAKGRTNLTPTWAGTKLPISESLSGAIRRSLEALDASARTGTTPPDAELAAALPMALAQRRLSAMPAADETLLEVIDSREGRHLFIYPFEGRLVHAGLAALLALRLGRRTPATFMLAVNDYGLELLCPQPFDFVRELSREGDAGGLFSRHLLAEDALASVSVSELAKLQFREIARVAGLVVQNMPGASRTGKQFAASSSLIFDVLTEFDPGNLLLEQARREVLQRHFEEGRLARTLDRLAAGPRIVRTPDRVTPLALPLVIERQAGSLSTQTLMERIEALRRGWDGPAPSITPDMPPDMPPDMSRSAEAAGPQRSVPKARSRRSRRPRPGP